MLLKAKALAFLGALAAFSTILLLLGTVIQVNTLFFLAGASFLVGVAVREQGLGEGFAFFAVCSLLALWFVPDKWHVLTYSCFGLYIFASEFVHSRMYKIEGAKRKKWLFFALKCVAFNLMYIPLLVFFPQLFYLQLGRFTLLVLVAAGQLGWVVFDYAYEWFMGFVWGRLRKL